MTPSEKMRSRKVRGWVIEWMRKTEKHEWDGGKNRQNESCDLSVLDCVSLSLSQWQVWNSGEPWAESSLVHTAAHRGFTGWQTEPRAVLSIAYHGAVCSEVPQSKCLSMCHRPLSCFFFHLCAQKIFWDVNVTEVLWCEVNARKHSLFQSVLVRHSTGKVQDANFFFLGMDFKLVGRAS